MITSIHYNNIATPAKGAQFFLESYVSRPLTTLLVCNKKKIEGCVLISAVAKNNVHSGTSIYLLNLLKRDKKN